MNTQFTKTTKVAGFILAIGFSSLSFSEEDTANHKHYKATMPEESHQALIEKNAEKNKLEKAGKSISEDSSNPSHKHYKATMPEESHKTYMEKEKVKDAVDSTEKDKNHKHYKATMKGEKHNE